ncbi:MAG: sulfur carrier protein ThiS [Gammaproteobacteria bacterium]|nr:sulfur carrier protein ThiS [Gammaproteobacteria bacterium]
MRIVLNGEAREVADGTTLAGLLASLDLAGKRFAVEINEELVPRSEHPAYRLQDADQVEIVQAIGGG